MRPSGPARLALLLAACSLMPAPSRGQAENPAQRDEGRGAEAAANAGRARVEAPPAPRPSDELIARAALSRLTRSSIEGLATDAEAALSWLHGRTLQRVERASAGASDGRIVLVRDDDARRELSAELTEALERIDAYLVLADERQRRPPPPALLETAILSPRGVAAVRALFDATLAGAVHLDDLVLVPEIGGELVLAPREGTLAPVFVKLTDAGADALRAVAERRGDPTEVGELFESMPAAMAILDERGQLEQEVGLWHARTERGVAEPLRRRGWNRAVATVLTNAADSFSLTPTAQLDAMITREWSQGEVLVGPWHVHPPAVAADGTLTAGAPPSPDDRAVARTLGQFVTIAWKPDGFVAWDLSPVARGGEPLEMVHASDEWRAHFERASQSLAPARP